MTETRQQTGRPVDSGPSRWMAERSGGSARGVEPRSRPATTRGLPGLGAIRLALAEDPCGWKLARCWAVAPHASARVYEIHWSDEWAALVERYPLDVSRSRRHDWWRATGWTGRWVIPDYAYAAANWDAIHVAVAGYLTTAGLDLPVSGNARTMLAGWDPDATWWLGDVLTRPARQNCGGAIGGTRTAGSGLSSCRCYVVALSLTLLPAW